jgi:DNA repair exonuclease SbcCD ATPase subunit
MEQRLEELKKEREALEKNLEKNREEKLKELEKIDKALEKQKKDINKSTQKIAVSVDRSDIKERKLPNVAGKLTDINWVLERFTY